MTLTTLERENSRTDNTADDYSQWISVGYYAPNFHTDIDRELHRLAGLKPNWDAQGAVSVAPALIDAARDLVSKLPSNLTWPPSVVPMAKGNLQFEWHEGPRSLELEIEDPETVHYLKWHPEENVEEEGLIPICEISRIVDMICWFMRGVTYA